MRPNTATRTIVVSNPTGLHARPSMAIVNLVRRFQSKIQVRKGDQVADASSILDLMGLGAPQGTELVFTATGPDAEEALEAMAALFANSFGLHLD